MKDYNQGELFPDFDSNIAQNWTTLTTNVSEVKRKNKILNLHLHYEYPTEGVEDMPLLKAYNGPIPLAFCPITERKTSPKSFGLHFFLYDYAIESTWSTPLRYLPELCIRPCVLSPIFTTFVDRPRAINVWNVYRNRWVTSFWQGNGVNAIPSASWGNVDSFKYCFDGLPERSVIAVDHICVGKDRAYRILYRKGIEELIERKHPTKLLIYGEPLDFNPSVDVIYIESHIHKLRQL